MIHRFISKRYWADQSTQMGKVDELSKGFEDLINLSLGDPDIITHSLIIDKSYKDALAGHTKYTDFRGDPELRAEILKMYRVDWNLVLNDSEIMVVASGCLAMYLVLEAILDDGDEVIIHAPYFTPYLQQIELARGVPVVLDTIEEESFQINLERLERLITERTKAIIINTPNNPSGACFSRDTMEQVSELAIKHDLIIIADDIYGSYSFSEPFIPMITIDNVRDRTITINSFSKDYAMTGWRIGHVIAPDYIIQTIQQINENVVFTAPSISQRAAIHALRNRHMIQPGLVAEYRKRVLYAAERINSIPNMSVLTPKGTFYLFVNIKKTGLTSTQASEAILRDAHVLTIPGIAFGDCGEGYVRIACTVGVETLKEAFDRIAKMQIFSKQPSTGFLGSGGV